MGKRIVFFNYFHNGDIHASRGLVRQIINKVKQIDPTIQFAYSHKMAPNLLSDIPDLNYDSGALAMINNAHVNLHTANNSIYINTWYGQQNYKYMNRHGISFDTLYSALDDSCQDLFGFRLSDISDDIHTFFPTIDYTMFNITPVRNWLDVHPGKKILIENGRAFSDQAINFPMGKIIDGLATKHPNMIFILTSPDNVSNLAGNIFYSDNITNRQGRNDLNEISYLSTHCDVIIGRSSGVFAFTLTRENLFNRGVRYFNFSNIVPATQDKYWLSYLLRDKVNYKSTIVSTNESDTNKVFQIIDGGL